jgi:hypothetical protein
MKGKGKILDPHSYAAKAKVLVFKDAFSKLGFTVVTIEGIQRPKCTFCQKFLSNSQLTSSLLRRHRDIHTSKTEILEELPLNNQEQERNPTIVPEENNLPNSSTAKSVKLASYTLAHEIGKSGYPHNIGEKLLKPSLAKTTEILFGEKASNLVDQIPLSRLTVRRRIEEFSDDMELQAIEGIKRSKFFSIQLDESTDHNHEAQLLVYERYIDDKKIQDDFLFCKPLGITTKGEDIFRYFFYPL